MSLFQSLDSNFVTLQGRRTSLRSALAPRYCIPRLRRSGTKPLIYSNQLHKSEFANDKWKMEPTLKLRLITKSSSINVSQPCD